jgi:hypothetical protein
MVTFTSLRKNEEEELCIADLVFYNCEKVIFLIDAIIIIQFLTFICVSSIAKMQITDTAQNIHSKSYNSNNK